MWHTKIKLLATLALGLLGTGAAANQQEPKGDGWESFPDGSTGQVTTRSKP